MKKYLHLTMVFSNLLVGIVFFNAQWGELIAHQVFSFYFAWNVFAYTHNRNMIAPPMMAADVSLKGDQGARKFLFGLSILLSCFLAVGWIWRSIQFPE